MLAIDFGSLAHTIKEIATTPEDIARVWQSVLARDPQCILLMDSKPYWRTKIFPEYKGNRASNPLDPGLIEAGTSLGVPILRKDGLEADDWAGLMYLDKVLNQRPGVLRFFTVDTDWMQLIDDQIGIEWENMGKHSPSLRRHKEAVEWAFRQHNVWIPHPRYIGALKRILGDKADNIPPRHELPLTELCGDQWLNALKGAGYDIDELLTEVGRVYG